VSAAPTPVTTSIPATTSTCQHDNGSKHDDDSEHHDGSEHDDGSKHDHGSIDYDVHGQPRYLDNVDLDNVDEYVHVLVNQHLHD
jgi:hypothetical protein